MARAFGSGGVTPILSGSETPLSSGNMWQQEMAWRNRPLSDEELDSLLPGGYRIVTPPENYVWIVLKVMNNDIETKSTKKS